MFFRNAAYWASLILIAMIPCENVIDIAGVGTVSRAVGLLTAALWLVAILLTRRLRKPELFHIVVYMFVMWNGVSLIWSVDVDSTISAITTYAQLLALTYIIWDLYTTSSAINTGLQAYIFGAYITTGVVVVNFLQGNIQDESDGFGGTGFNTDDLGYVLALGIPVACYLAGARESSSKTDLLRLMNFFYIPAGLLGIALSGNRAGLIAAVPGLFLGLVAMIRTTPVARRAAPLILLLAFFMFVMIVPESSWDRWSTIGAEVSQGDLNGRIPIWREGMHVFSDHPVQGIGTGAHREGVGLNKVAHNTFVSVLVEVGMVGFVLFSAILAIATYRASCHRGWQAQFWLTLLLVWAIGSCAMSYELRKPTWLFLSLVVASAGTAIRQMDLRLPVTVTNPIRPSTAISIHETRKA